MRLGIIILINCCIFSFNASCQSISWLALNLERKQLLEEIASLQIQNDLDFPAGSFPAYRKYFYSKKLKPDDNLFYTLLILHNVDKFNANLDSADKMIVEALKLKAINYTRLFQNQQTKITYNFWPKYPPKVFPNGGWLNWFDSMNALPDDIDDCALYALVYQNDSNEIKRLKNIFLAYANGVQKQSKGFYKTFNSQPVYSTWLGKKYPIDIDISVLSNVLLLSAYTNTSFNAIDSASVDLIIKMIESDKHMLDAGYLSQHYAHSATIIYHIARLIHATNNEHLLTIKAKLISNVQLLLSQSNQSLEILLLENALLYLGESIDRYPIINKTDLLKCDYPYFIANMAAILHNPFKRVVSTLKIGRFDYFSYPFNVSLKYEQVNLLLQSYKLP